ncbi:metallophosphoesterase [Pontibacter sp. KCTC 32443]|uniref:metallophosphoesterase n=1 Tax=Pontibacter TaxID=323449 RepID=UPI00164E3CED|nr:MULTISPECIES: metallophosphoesterase [Pontibacter]MBC5775831.1 metallophosphoesterase [Pontibacter sp. KCTC 32443]
MKIYKKVIKVVFRWSIITLCGYWVLTTLIFGHAYVDETDHEYPIYWSGIDAFINDEEIEFALNKPVEVKLDGIDGPYIYTSESFTVSANNKLIKKAFDMRQPVEVNVNNEDRDAFHFSLRGTYHTEADNYKMPDKLIAISDIEGNFNAFYSFLVKNGVMDEKYNWTFGKGHLVLNGDFVDRGSEVTQVLWLIYMLEEKAEKAGGKVHYIIGNHEVMNLYGDNSDTDTKYVAAAKQMSGKQNWEEAGKYLFSAESELGRWLRSKNVVEKIGDYIFVHAGIKSKLIEENLTIQEINTIARKYYGIRTKELKLDEKERLVLNSFDSPYWDRSYAMNILIAGVFAFHDPFNASYHSTTQDEAEQILKFYDASKMVVGHNVVSDITADYEGKVIKIDVKHGRDKYSGRTKGLFIENGIEYKVDDLGKRTKL